MGAANVTANSQNFIVNCPGVEHDQLAFRLAPIADHETLYLVVVDAIFGCRKQNLAAKFQRRKRAAGPALKSWGL